MDTKPLEFMQSVIARLAANSFQMKAWNVALATAAIGFVAARDGKPTAAIYGLAPALAFWILDAYYLALEFRFRDLYNTAIRSMTPSYDLTIRPVDFSLMIFAMFRPTAGSCSKMRRKSCLFPPTLLRRRAKADRTALMAAPQPSSSRTTLPPETNGKGRPKRSWSSVSASTPS